ncbi:MAG: thioesterase family protein [Phycisphaerales bacterium]
MPDPRPAAALTPARPAPRAGSTRLRIRYSECDPMGVAHHAAYAPWLEIARTELLRETGITYADLERAGTYLVVATLTLNYKRPLFYDDLIEVRTRVSGGSRVKIEHTYEIALAEEGGHGARGRRTPGELATTAASILVCVDRDGRVRPLPEWLTPAEC